MLSVVLFGSYIKGGKQARIISEHDPDANILTQMG